MRTDPLWRAVRLLDVDPKRVLGAVLAGAGGLGSAIALAAISAWLIARAAQMPPVPALSIAAVAVRLFGISRGVLRYVERLVSHDVALRGMANLRVRLYERLASGSPAGMLALRRGDLLARVGADVDAVGDVVVRGLLPMAVAGVVGLGSAIAMGVFLPTAGVALAACLLLAGVVAPWWAYRTARATERESAAARSDLAATTQTLLDGAGELTVAGRVAPALDELRAADARLARAVDRGAGPAAVAAALGPLATGIAMLAALVLGIPAVTAGGLDPVELAVVVLTPLAVFEATSVLPGAAVSLLRSREAARRVVDLLDSSVQAPAATPAAPASGDATADVPAGVAVLRAEDLACGWPDGPVLVRGLDLELVPGRSTAIVGPSGLGKTTLLLTLAGLLEARAGHVLVDGRPVHVLDRAAAASRVALTTEDAHVFDTTVLENLRVARGDVTPDEATAVLRAVGLDGWLDGLPDGLDTVLGSDAARVSGGERRRLLVARTLLAAAPVLLLDEPTEHVDAGGRALLAGLLDGTLAPGRAVVVVTHRLGGLDAADEVILLDATGTVRARGHHHALLHGEHAEPAYAAAWRAEQQAEQTEGE
ncbi:thiol reductant ABC exporter subunit CydC [Actinotalea sp. M2MS4P-6]|uniref:thiol reductant ABC exporter subunit CydC n=1 Tax=Actinotalea sp. M2MS4P-6 TaxID=2983762 RepID=UPI0021E50979|nr:thiol reductant ABC exporter subunit CydC [Actinotalea sp. M2MS4P-6]MCV2393974.1 thiol reductant ABC exporter subunit CydC [Actinotalea sp. M2MS4P-6]